MCKCNLGQFSKQSVERTVETDTKVLKDLIFIFYSCALINKLINKLMFMRMKRKRTNYGSLIMIGDR